MSSLLVAFVSSFILGALLTRTVRGLALRAGAVDHALVSRKIHKAPVPRLGGVAIVLSFFVVLAAQLVVSGVPEEDYGRVAALVVGGAIIFGLGLVDDLKGADAKLKFVVQFAVAALAYWGGFRIDAIDTQFGAVIDLGWLAVPFTMVWIVGVINALNLIDGLDGLAAGLTVIAASVVIAITWTSADLLMLQAAVALSGTVLGFLVYNFNPASIFMGDTGSMFLGYVLATTAIHTNERNGSTVALAVPVIALGVPILDTLLALGRRAARGAPLFRGDRGHLHHRLLDRGLSHRQTVIALYAAATVLGVAAIVLTFANPSVAVWFLVVLAGTTYLILWRLGYSHFWHAPKWMALRRQNVWLRKELGQVGRVIKAARTREEVWEATQAAARLLRAECVALSWRGGPGAKPDFSTHCEGLEQEVFRVRYGLDPERLGDAFIELGWTDGRSSIDRDVEIAIEELCGCLAVARTTSASPANEPTPVLVLEQLRARR